MVEKQFNISPQVIDRVDGRGHAVLRLGLG
jgi:hypothetical protein